jgi:uncharacterized membrane protein YphA (DoxX/SURF4 family)
MHEIATTSGWLIVRATIAYVFLYAAWMNTRDSASRTWTIGQTELILGFVPVANRHRVAVLGAVAGMVMLYGGGISILFGIEGRIGAIVLILFSAMGMQVHRVNRAQALPLANEIASTAPSVKDKALTLGWSAYGAHVAAGLKNISLIGINALFVLDADMSSAGPWTQPWIVSDLTGNWFR